MAARKKRAPYAPPAPALIRQGVYTAVGAALVAGAAGLAVLWLNPAPKAAKEKAGGCGCGCSGSATAQRAKVYG